jgi:hypothetical protein
MTGTTGVPCSAPYGSNAPVGQLQLVDAAEGQP